MTKKIKKLEKETTMYRSRWESSNKALLEMAEEVCGDHAAFCILCGVNLGPWGRLLVIVCVHARVEDLEYGSQPCQTCWVLRAIVFPLCTQGSQG